MRDHVDEIMNEWAQERPKLDVTPMAALGRLTSTTSAVMARLEATFAEHALDASGFDLLATLVRSGPPYELTPSELNRSAMVTSSAIAQRLNKLESRGLVRRSKDLDDRRSTRVQLTPAGNAAVEAALPAHLATEATLIEGVDADDLATFISVLQRIAANAAALTP